MLNSRRSQKADEGAEEGVGGLKATTSRKRIEPKYKAVTMPEGFKPDPTADNFKRSDDRKNEPKTSTAVTREEKERDPNIPDDSDDEELQRREKEKGELAVWKRFSLPSLMEGSLSNSNPDGMKRRSLADRFSHREVMAMLENFKREQDEKDKLAAATGAGQSPVGSSPASTSSPSSAQLVQQQLQQLQLQPSHVTPQKPMSVSGVPLTTTAAAATLTVTTTTSSAVATPLHVQKPTSVAAPAPSGAASIPTRI